MRIKEKLRIIKYKIVAAYMYLKFDRYEKDKRVYLLSTPLHGNIGDQAIASSEYDLFRDIFPDKTIIEIPSKYINGNISLWKKLIDKSPIFVHGGGYIGSLWKNENENLCKIFEVFKNNKIVVLPQSIYFREDDYDEIRRMQVLLSNCKDITLCERERYSYRTANAYFGCANNILIPDIVLYPKKYCIHKSIPKKQIVFCMRQDHEKTSKLTPEEERIFIRNNNLDSYVIVHTDTVINQEIQPTDRDFIIKEKIKEFSESSLVITDRLHGMILSSLAGTPAIVFDNISHKVYGEYEWIKDITNVRIVTELGNIYDAVEMIENRVDFDNTTILPHFNALIECLRGINE